MTKRSAVSWAVIGGMIGVVVGFMIGGVGVAAGGDAMGFPASLLLGIVGAAVGYHFGRVKDLKAR